MALQSSGAISLSQIQAEYGGANPISMSEYYRNGSYVPSTIGGGAGAWTAYTYVDGNTNWTEGTFGNFVNWGGTPVANPAIGATTITADGYEYEKGTLQGSTSSKYGSSYFWSVRRRTVGSSITVNANVPTSGTISMSNFYGGRKT